MKHIDLFSGIGGFALAVDTVWPNSEHIFCEIDPFCTQVLKKHWPESKIYGDIRTLTNTRGQESNGVSNQQGKQIFETWDLLTGGFPCQPFSQAGRRQGTADDRYLWPEMFRVIREFHPTWVIAENVRGLVTWNDGMVLEQVCADLEAEGYEVQPLIIPAVAVNAPHRRDRIWFIAHSNTDKRNREERGGFGKESTEETSHRQENNTSWELARATTEFSKDGEFDGHEQDDTNPSNKRLEGREHEESQRHSGQLSGDRSNERWDWNSDWVEVAAEFCTLDDGLPNGLVRPRGWRNAALKAAGNAIVPQVAIQIMKAIKHA